MRQSFGQPVTALFVSIPCMRGRSFDVRSLRQLIFSVSAFPHVSYDVWRLVPEDAGEVSSDFLP